MKKKWIRDALLFGIQTKTWKIMRLNAIFLFLCLSQAWAISGYSQATRLTLKMSDSKIIEVLDEIEEQSEFYFLFNQKLVDVERKVDIDVQEKPIDFILQNLFAGTNVSHMVIDRQIVLTTFNEELLPQQQRIVSGKVTDQSGQPLPGVTVVVKGTTQGTVTNADGNYSLTNIPEDATLVFSFVGMKTQEVVVGNQTNINVTLKQDVLGIEEVVAIGYGVVRKSDLTGAVTSVSSDEISSSPVARLDQALQGKAAGVQVTSISGEPGTGTTIRIRGGNSISADNEPLYVIDGFIGGGDLNSINPNDIESIEILKDATATSIYGSRGANGVILITTKRGIVGKTRVNVNAYSGVQEMTGKIEFLSGPQRAQYQNEYAELQNQPIPFPNIDEIDNYNWTDAVTQIAPINNVSVSVAGGDEKTMYYFSGNYMNQEGIIKNSGFNRYQMRFNIDKKVFSWLDFNSSLNISHSNKANNTVNLNNVLEAGLTLLPLYQEDGSYTFVNPISGTTFSNPIAQYELEKNNTYRTRLLGNLALNINPVKNLFLKSSFGFDFNFDKTNEYLPGILPVRLDQGLGGFARVANSDAQTILNENTITYSFEINENNKIEMLGGGTYQQYKSESIWATGTGFTNDVLEYNRLSTGDPEQKNYDTGYSDWRIISFIGRINYNLLEKYLLTIVSRQDGSSRLASNHKWAFFPSAAVAWRLCEEPFIKSLNIFNTLKIRTSYGRSGNQAINIYQSLPTLSVTKVYFNSNEYVGYKQGNIGNPDLKWETTNQLNFGIEAGFWDGRFSFEFDYYIKKTKDLLLTVEIPWTTGYRNKLDNIGEVENRGMELLLNTVPIVKKNLTWEVDLNISRNKNKVVDLGGKDFIDLFDGSRLIVGEPAASFVGAIYDGVWNTQEEINSEPELMPAAIPGAPKFKDVNENGTFDGYDDYAILGNSQPEFYGGIKSVLKYKNFDFELYFQGSYGNELMNSFARSLYFGSFATNVHKMAENRWTENNPNSNIPRAGTYQTAFRTPNSIWVQDGSFLRLKTLRFGYNISSLIEWINRANLYFTLDNVFVIDNYDWGWDPEVSKYGNDPVNQGFDDWSYPKNRTYVIGLNIEF